MISALPVPGQSCWSRMEQRAAEIRRTGGSLSSWPWAMAPFLRVPSGQAPAGESQTPQRMRSPGPPFRAGGRLREDLVLAALDLVPELAGVGLPCHRVSFGVGASVGDDIVAVASGLDGAEEGPAEVGLGFGGEHDRDDAVGQGFLQEGGQAGADAANRRFDGVDGAGVPVIGKGADAVPSTRLRAGVKGCVLDAQPEPAVDSAVVGQTAELDVDLDRSFPGSG